MSIYLVNKFLYRADNDADFRQRLLEDPVGMAETYPFSPDELTALINGDVGKLYQMGVHTFLLNHMARYELYGVNRDNYLDKIRDGMDYDPRFEEGQMPTQYFVNPAEQQKNA